MVANVSTASGLDPIRRLDGAKWGDSLRAYRVLASQANAIFRGDPVIKIAGSADVNGVLGVDLATAGATNRITGVVCGFLGASVANAGQPSFFAMSGTPGNIFRPASTSLDYYVLVNDDPEAEFAVMSSDNVAIPTVAIIGKNVNLVAAAGSPFTGASGWKFDPNTAATGATLQFRITGVLSEADNTPGLANARYVGQINLHTELPGQAGI